MRSAVEEVEAALERVGVVEARVRAFAWLDGERARKVARERDAAVRDGRGGGVLQGMVVGVKDVIDTAGVPTECGSALFAGRVPEESAPLVRRLEAAGAVVLGKTVTAECAFLYPGLTRNPWDVSRTPGGSSMGSAAAVACGEVRLAVGTQTNGSVIRPAAFCGVVGFKPSAGRIPKEGVMEFSRTLDQVGGFARSVEDVARLAAAMEGEEWGGSGVRGQGSSGETPRLAVVRTAEWEHASEAARERFEGEMRALREAGAALVEGEEAALPEGMEGCVPVHRTIMQCEGARALGALVAAQPEKVSETLRRYVEEGARISEGEYEAALRERERLIGVFAVWCRQFDGVVTLPAVGEAPGPETTGDPRFCTRWTLVGAPALTLPTGLGPSGLPLGLQVVGTPGEDARVLRAAAWIEGALPAPRWSLEQFT